MANSERVKLTADLIEAASERNCKIPKAAIEEILNDKDNKTVLGYPDDYVDVSQPISAAEDLIEKRKNAKEELY